jgi:S-adenosylmethionine hydrolase
MGITTSLLAQTALVLQSDFGLEDGSVAAVKGVAFGVSPSLPIFDLTHRIPPYNIWEAAVRLDQAAPYWPAGTVFVSIVDPGVGTSRKSVVLKTRSGHYFVTPDNGTLTLVAEHLGIEAVREIDERVNRLPGSERSHTFHGRDVYGYTGARLAAGVIGFEQVGPVDTVPIVRLPYERARREGDRLIGGLVILDRPYGNVWTNVPAAALDSLGVRAGDRLAIRIRHDQRVVFQGSVPFVKSFGAVQVGQPLAYLNSLLELALALNQADFAARYRIAAGPGWRIEVSPIQPKP